MSPIEYIKKRKTEIGFGLSRSLHNCSGPAFTAGSRRSRPGLLGDDHVQEMSIRRALPSSRCGRPRHRSRPTCPPAFHAISNLRLVRLHGDRSTGISLAKPRECLISKRIATKFPASLLHLHCDVQLICDAAAVEGRKRDDCGPRAEHGCRSRRPTR
jgi:hypothetical protein